jgi:serine/threonine protein kinase
LTNSFHPTASLFTSEPESAHPGIQLGASLDGYILLENIGRGGMGIVFKAKQPNSEQIVAVKMIRDGIFADQEARPRFLQEVRAMGRLQSAKNIVPIYHVGQYLNFLFYVMPFLAGGNLSKQRKRYSDEPRKAVAVVEKVARAVHQLHVNQILHRDIKPSNILLDANDEPYLSDFGLAKLVDQEQSLTGSHQRLGTPAYMAPEQTGLLPTPMSAQTDIWALGVLLYELLTGVRPFAAPDSEISTTLPWKIVNETPPRPRELRPDLDPGLEAVILKCLEKQPADRYASAEELAEELGRWLCGGPLRTKPVNRIRRLGRFLRTYPKSSTALGFLLLVISIGAPAVLHLSRPEDRDRPLHQIQQQLAAGKPVVLIGEKAQPRWSSWMHGKNVQTSSDKDGYFVANAWGKEEGMLELVRDIPTDRYRLKGKIRHDTSNFNGSVGVFFGHHAKNTETVKYDLFFQFSYNDVDSNNAKPRPKGFPPETFIPNTATFSPVIRTEVEGVGPAFNIFAGQAVAHFECASLIGQKWRDFQIAITPEFVIGQFEKQPEKRISLKAQIASLERDTKNRAREDPVRQSELLHCEAFFNHRGSLGIYIRGGSAAFSDFVLEPLPQEEN